MTIFKRLRLQPAPKIYMVLLAIIGLQTVPARGFSDQTDGASSSQLEVQENNYSHTVQGTDESIGESINEEPLYAPVSKVAVTNDDQGELYLTLAGEYPYTYVGCMVLQEVRITLSQDDMLVVQPFAAFADADACLPQRDDKGFVAHAPLGNLQLADGSYVARVQVIDGFFDQMIKIDTVGITER